MKIRAILASVSCSLILLGAGAVPVQAATSKVDPALQPAVSKKLTPAIKLKGAQNVRDLGGYKTKSGQRVKKDRLLRSDSLEKLTKADTKKLVKKYHLKEIFDLRTKKQMAEKPDVKIAGVKYLHASVLGTKSNYDNDDAGMYRDMANKPAAKKSYRKLLVAAAKDKKGALLFHCSHGMDRTGTAAAILYTILGVDKADIQRDYLLSNTQLNVDWAKPDLLNLFYSQVKGKYGSMNNYIKKGLKITPAQIKQIKANYLTKA
ncbi:tyrosine-protein phosphatase [Levilactobacillus yonginensis]